MLGRLELAAASFAILTECAAERVGVGSYPIDADAVCLAINAIRRDPAVDVGIPS